QCLLRREERRARIRKDVRPAGGRGCRPASKVFAHCTRSVIATLLLILRNDPKAVRFGRLQFARPPFQPLPQLFGVGEHASTPSAWNSADGQTALFLPAANGPLVAVEEGSDFLPGIQAVVGYLSGGAVAHPVIPANVRCCPLPGRAYYPHYTRR